MNSPVVQLQMTGFHWAMLWLKDFLSFFCDGVCANGEGELLLEVGAVRSVEVPPGSSGAALQPSNSNRRWAGQNHLLTALRTQAPCRLPCARQGCRRGLGSHTSVLAAANPLAAGPLPLPLPPFLFFSLPSFLFMTE